MRWSVMQKNCSTIFSPDVTPRGLLGSKHHLQGPGHSKGFNNQNMTVSTIPSNLVIHLQPNLVWWYIIISWNVVWKIGLLWSANVWNVNKCLSRRYFLNRSTFCNQTWYSGVLSWVGVPCRIIGLLSLWSRSQQRLIWSEYDWFYYLFWTADSFAFKFGLMVHFHMPECRVKKKKNGLLFSWWRSQWNFKLLMNIRLDNLLNCWTFYYQLGIVMHHHHHHARVKRPVCYLRCQGHNEGLIWLNDDFLLCLLKCWSLCCQTWFDGLNWIVFWKDLTVLLCLRSESQQKF